MNRHLMETQNLVISLDYSWFLAKNLAYVECRIMKFHYRNSSNVSTVFRYRQYVILLHWFYYPRTSELKVVLALSNLLLHTLQFAHTDYFSSEKKNHLGKYFICTGKINQVLLVFMRFWSNKMFASFIYCRLYAPWAKCVSIKLRLQPWPWVSLHTNSKRKESFLFVKNKRDSSDDQKVSTYNH